jgi:hypothetical protein
VGQFSDDGQWWWDGSQWVATSQVVLPQLAMTEFERSGKLAAARSLMGERNTLLGASIVEGIGIGSSRLEPLIGLPLGLLYLNKERRALREYRTWTLEQLALTVEVLLGPDEPMLAGETTMFRTLLLATITRDYAVAVTAAHVLVLRFDFLDGQPRWVALAAHPRDVAIQLSSGPLGYNPTLVVTRGNVRFAIRGQSRIFEPQPVLNAWRQAASGAAAQNS